jgi:hypothetical protein
MQFAAHFYLSFTAKSDRVAMATSPRVTVANRRTIHVPPPELTPLLPRRRHLNMRPQV